ncbi:Glutathione import ATP-binding protein GsiA [Rhodovastum atsumiense]|uniref:ABC transporter ATP-binding protein n=1 Tax=Rhodovastum atsumiense TaxID=504468 RepID=A0A5M6IJF7_9PROT|nr:ABC transporter ATP-binding protein [Rhodovastum atsumiense]KAA5608391.1 ABC transporter ATP-binding protein [Rhodovastum atsumiense]CAH2599963.1 Glutathione import ATP-binding protein GsiA [Rhodovastum atsumiense]
MTVIPAADPALAIERLSITLPAGAERRLAVEDVSLALPAGQITCVVGASGSGKTMLANAVIGLLPEGVRAVAGEIRCDGQNLLALPPAALRQIRGRRVGMVFQEPMTALNPLQRIGRQIGEILRTHTDLSAAAIRARVLQLLGEVRLPDPATAIDAYPHQLSGGQRQRAMIAMAMALEPPVLIADEPTTALDVTTQAQILALIRALQRRRGTAVLFITHDFGVVADIADQVAVMSGGHLVEHGPAASVLQQPRHAATRALIAAVPTLQVPPPRPVPSRDAALRIDGLTKTFAERSLLGRVKRRVAALAGVSLTLPRGSTLGIVGESGSGKSTLARCLVRLLEADAGAVRIGDCPFSTLRGSELRTARRRVQMIFQDPFASLNPRRRVGTLLAQGPVLQGVPVTEARRRATELLELVGLDPAAAERYPHEFSGGQRQRICIARALTMQPEILVADEPVSALDVSIQAQVLALLADLQARLGLSMVFITHDLRIAASICDRIAVMQNGRVVEEGETARLFTAPAHPYTAALLAAVPGRRERFGSPPTSHTNP